MVRGRHVRRSSLWAWFTGPAPPQPAWRTVHAQSLVLLGERVHQMDDEVARLRSGQERSTAAAVAAELRAQRLEGELAQARGELAQVRNDLDALRGELSVLREEVVWAFAERRLPEDRGTVVDLKRPVTGTG